MSGSGGEAPSSWGGGGSADDCDFRLTTTLRSPNPEVVATVAVGDRLLVEVDEETPAVVVLKDGQRVGSITERVPKFVACGRSGHQYRAIVKSNDEGKVVVETERR